MLGNGGLTTTDVPAMVANLEAVQQISAGYTHTCARNSSGYAFCWGRDASGELGNGPASAADVLVPELVPGIIGAVSISAGNAYTCAAAANGTLYCWGNGFSGKTGLGSAANVDSPREVAGISAVREVVAGHSHTCAITSANELYCWGRGSFGGLGVGDTSSSSTPKFVLATGSNVAHASLSSETTCALLHDGSQYCWGKNEFAQLGLGYAGTIEASPKLLSGKAVALVVGTKHGCSISEIGSFSSSQVTKCWGYASLGVLGRGRLTAPIPGLVDTLTEVASISVGSSHVCALTRADGDVYCWGSNVAQQLGVSAGGGVHPVPLLVTGMPAAAGVTAGVRHSCAWLAEGNAYCWGEGSHGRLGYGGVTSKPAPEQIPDIQVIGMAAGDFHTCSWNAGEAHCWGQGTEYALGNGGESNQNSPVQVTGLADVVRLDTKFISCAVVYNGSAFCWGKQMHGRLGTGSLLDALSPAQVSTLANAVTIAVGSLHACAVTAIGATYCWGSNSFGELGVGSTTEYAEPQLVFGLSNVTQVSAGDSVTCASTRFGESYCWGSNHQSALGVCVGRSTQVPHAIELSASTFLTSTQASVSCAVAENESAYCWGRWESGMLGRAELGTQSSGVLAISNDQYFHDAICPSVSPGATAVATASAMASPSSFSTSSATPSMSSVPTHTPSHPPPADRSQQPSHPLLHLPHRQHLPHPCHLPPSHPGA